jgi:hypothetical protein
MVINNPCQNIDSEAVLVASYVLRVRIFLSPNMAVSGYENAVLGKDTLIRKEDKTYEVRCMFSFSEQTSTKFDTRSKVIRSHRLNLLEVISM